MEFHTDNQHFREMYFERKGDVVHGHAHNFSHPTYVQRGGMRVEHLRITKPEVSEEIRPAILANDGEILVPASLRVLEPAEFEVVASVDKYAGRAHTWVHIEKGVYHRITALMDDTMGHCLYPHRLPQNLIEYANRVQNPRYLELLLELNDIAKAEFGDIVQEYTGWGPATN